MTKKGFTTRHLAVIAVMSALSLILAYWVRFKMFPVAPFLEYDMGDVPIYIVSLGIGPLAGLLMTIVVAVLQGLTVSAESGIIGVVQHIVSTGSFVMIAGFIYRMRKTTKFAILSVLIGSAVRFVLMVGFNLLLTPIFMKVPFEKVLDLLLVAIIPFNIIEPVVNGTIALLLFKSLVRTRIFERYH